MSLQDRGGLLEQSQERDAQLARGEYCGWMHGFPLAVKDLIATKGIRTTQGSPIFKDFVPAADAIVVERMKRAGGIVIGKTNTPEFGLGSNTYNDVFGRTLNAYDQSKTSGGSSGGAGVAVALRMLPVADGSDHGGSLRNPAAWNNVFGFRPSYGRVPAQGLDVFYAYMGVQGPMARNVPDLAMLLSVQAGHDPRLPLSNRQDPAQFAGDLRRDFKGVRIAWSGDFGGAIPFEPGVLELCRSALKTFEALGCIVEEAWPDFPIEQVWQNWRTLRAWQTGVALKDLYNDPAKRALMKPEAKFEVESGQKLSAFEIYDASAVRTAWYQAVRAFFEKYDYFVLPAGQVFPFDAAIDWPKEINGKTMDTYHRWMEVMIPVTMSSCPALAVPAGFNDRGLPMGLQIVGPNHGELACLQLASRLRRSDRLGREAPAPAARQSSLKLRNLRHALPAADQPPDAEQVQNSDPEPVPEAVVRHAVQARPVHHVDVADLVALALDQRRQEAVQPVEIRQRQKQIALKRLEAATGVARAVAQDRAAHAVGNARLEFLEAGRLAADALAGDQPDARSTGLQRLDQLGKKRRIVLAVAVERDDDGRPRRRHAAAQRGRLTARLRMPKRAQPRVLRLQRTELGLGAVGRSVVDVNDLVRPASVERSGDLRHQRRHVAGFVAHRHDDADGGIGCRFGHVDCRFVAAF